MWSKDIKDTVNKLRCGGKTMQEISDIMELSVSSVQNLLEYKLQKCKQKTGPKSKISKRLSTCIKRFVASSNKIGRKVTARTIMEECDVPLKKRAMNNWLKERKYKYSKLTQKITLSKQHKKKRVEIISQWIQDELNWKNCVFTDEKRFTLDGPDNW